jgi:hypothetical protein
VVADRIEVPVTRLGEGEIRVERDTRQRRVVVRELDSVASAIPTRLSPASETSARLEKLFLPVTTTSALTDRCSTTSTCVRPASTVTPFFA